MTIFKNSFTFSAIFLLTNCTHQEPQPLLQNAGANPYEPAIKIKDVDLKNTGVWMRVKKTGKDTTAKFEEKKFALKGLQNLLANRNCNLSGGFAKGGKSRTSYRYRLAFKKAMPIGYMLATTNKRNWWRKESIFKYLKASAPYPGDPDNDDHWENIKFDRFNAITFPLGFKTRAMLYYENRIYGQSRVVKWIFVKKRLFNMTPYTIAQGEVTPFASNPKRVEKGGTWHNAGKDYDSGIISRLKITPQKPSWFNFVFKKKEAPIALRFTSNIGKFELYRFIGSKDLNPAIAKQEAWKIIDYKVIHKFKVNRRNEMVITFETPPTQAIRIEILETEPAEQKICHLGNASLYIDLKDAATPPVDWYTRSIYPEPKIIAASPVKTFTELDMEFAQLKLSKFKMGYSAEKLLFQWTIIGCGPLRNLGDDFRRYFKTGSAVDVKLALNPDADPNRKKPLEGDIRILVTQVKGKPVAVLYRSIAPNAKPGEAWSVTTPAGGTTSFDQVRILTAKEASIKIIGSSDSYTVNLSIPMK
ncbi:MAG: hypothetical protein HRT89_21605, partial [Lentisphaeria bacterium]|nr:hypothetical protein [Lentisphaeria bacterium]